MDTREKIVPLDQLETRLGDIHWRAVVSAFDPITLRHAEWLTALSVPETMILAVVEPGVNPLLPPSARAVLAAALRCVRLVVVAEEAALPKLPHLEIVRDTAGDRERHLAFVQHVRGRQTAR